MSTSPKRYGLDVKDDLELELRLRRIEAALEGKLNSNTEDEQSGSRSTVPQVTGLRVTGQTPGAVTIGWNPVKIPNLRRYDVEFSQSIGFTDKQTFSENTTSHTFITASETGGGGGATWFARVRAVNTFGQAGQYSITLNLTTGQAQSPDLAPGSVTTVQITPTGVAATSVSYDNSSSGLTADDVQEAIDELSSGTPTPVLSEASTSAQTAITLNGVTTIAHGLTAAPSLVNVKLVCVTADGLFIAGDVINIGSSYNYNAGGSSNRFLTVRVDATNVYIDVANTNAIRVADKGGGAGPLDLTTANWRYVVYAAR